MNRKKITAGNWKMNLTVDESLQLIRDLGENLTKFNSESNDEVELIVAPTYLSLHPIRQLLLEQKWEDMIHLAAQDVHYEEDGAFTGKISASMLNHLHLKYCLVGHSEQRSLFGETNESVRSKVVKLLEYGIVPILCIGETLAERNDGLLEKILKEQLTVALKGLNFTQNLIIAYEPVWAIGTGKSASVEDAQGAHTLIRSILEEIISSRASDLPILYGGSVKPDNAESILACPDIDGVLVGGASLKSSDFLSIHRAWSRI